MAMQETINQRIFHIRRLSGYTQADMAKMLNMKLSTYAQAERKGKISTELVVKIAELLDVDVGYLITGCKNKKETETMSTQVSPVKPPDPNITPKYPKEESLRHLLSSINLSDDLLTALQHISKSKRFALYKLIVLTQRHKKFDIEAELARIEAQLSYKKDL